MASIDYDLLTKRSLFDANASLKENLDQAKRTLSDLFDSFRITNAMHATLILGTVLAAATAAIAYPRANQRPLASTNTNEGSWDSTFSDTCSSEGFFRSATSCQRFHRCARTIPNSRELVKYEFECPADQIYCPSQISCVHPGACAERCREPDQHSMKPSDQPATQLGRKSSKCKPFVCERPGTFTDPLNCNR